MTFRRHGGVNHCAKNNSIHAEYYNISDETIANKSGLNGNSVQQFESSINVNSNLIKNIGCIGFQDGTSQCYANPEGTTGPTGVTNIGQIGPQGPSGITGAQGPQGPTGAKSTNPYWQQTSAKDGIYYDQGKVGIGTNTPTNTLDVTGTANISEQLNVYTIGTNYDSSGPTLTNANIGWSTSNNNVYGDFFYPFDYYKIFSNLSSDHYYFCIGTITRISYGSPTDTPVYLSGSDGSNQYYSFTYTKVTYPVLQFSFTFYAKTNNLYLSVGDVFDMTYNYYCTVVRIA